MKIIGGKAKGRSIVAPKSDCIRITTDRLKESLFNSIGPLEGVRFLDLFAGTGNVGIEAMSRGADVVVSVEQRRRHAEAIRNNIQRCGFEEGFEIIVAPVEKAVPLLLNRRECFEIIFADPPYEKGYADKILHIPGMDQLLAEEGLFIVEHSVREECIHGGAFQLTEQRRYGDTALTFFRPSAGGSREGL